MVRRHVTFSCSPVCSLEQFHPSVCGTVSLSLSLGPSVYFTTCIKQPTTFHTASEEALQCVRLINGVSRRAAVVPGFLFMSSCKLCTAAGKQPPDLHPIASLNHRLTSQRLLTHPEFQDWTTFSNAAFMCRNVSKTEPKKKRAVKS